MALALILVIIKLDLSSVELYFFVYIYSMPCWSLSGHENQIAVVNLYNYLS